MPDTKVDEFLESLARSRLLDPKRLEALRSQTRKPGAEFSVGEIAKQLVKRNILTRWQAKQLLAGQTGFVLAEYQMLNPIGKGGMGHVFRARKSNTNEIVAVKVMARRHTDNQSLVKRFRREIRAASRLSSPYIVKALDAGRIRNIDFLVMEYVDGEPLDDLTNRVGILSIGEACEIARQAALGLQHAHESGMVHRDIKPANLILGWNDDGIGILRIMDMGLVRMQADGDQQGEDRAVTRAGQVMGTPDYMAPEQGWDTATVDIRSDIYSLGCTLFRMITGTVPFRGDNPLQILMARCAKDAPSVNSIRPEIAEPISAVVQKMTRRDPESRYQTPQEVADALSPFCRPPTRKWHAKLPVHQQSPGGVSPKTPISTKNREQSDADFRGDASYEQFLSEMNSNTESGLLGTVVDAPASSTSALQSINRQRTRPTAKLSRRAILASAFAVVFCIIGLALVVVFNGPSSNNSGGDRDSRQAATDSNADSDASGSIEAGFEPIERQTVLPGETSIVDLKWHARRDGQSVDAKLSFEAPGLNGIRLDEQAGQLVWDVPDLQPPGDYSAYVTLSAADASDLTHLARTSITFTIENETVEMRVRQLPRRTAVVGEELAIPILPRVTLRNVADRMMRVEKSPQTPAGMSVDLGSGMVTWTPQRTDVGKHDVVIRLIDDETETARMEVRFVVRVTDQPIRFRAIAPEPLSIQAGRPLSFTPRMPNGDPLPDEIRLVPGPGSPPGTAIHPETNEITWTPAPDLKGQFSIPIAIVSRTPERELSADSTTSLLLVVNVTSPSSLQLPASEAITEARVELRELMQRDFAQARSPLQKSGLAHVLLERAAVQESETIRYVMLDEALELGRSARDLPAELTASHQLRLTFGIDEPERVGASIEAFRTRDVPAQNREVLMEHLLRIAYSAFAEEDFPATAMILSKASQAFRPRGGDTPAAMLADDLQQARALADEIAAAVASDNPAPSLKHNELERILTRWQFEPLFQNQQALSFLRISNLPELSDQGRSLWTFEPNRIRLRSDPIAGLTGFIDQSQQPERGWIRFSIGPETTAGRLIFGGRQNEDSLDGFTLVLGSDGFSQLNSLRDGKSLAQPSKAVVRPDDRAVEVSLQIDGNNVEVQVDGTVVISTRLESAAGGTLGMIVPLTPGGRIPVLDIRNARVLRLPGKPE